MFNLCIILRDTEIFAAVKAFQIFGERMRDMLVVVIRLISKGSGAGISRPDHDQDLVNRSHRIKILIYS